MSHPKATAVRAKSKARRSRRNKAKNDSSPLRLCLVERNGLLYSGVGEGDVCTYMTKSLEWRKWSCMHGCRVEGGRDVDDTCTKI